MPKNFVTAYDKASGNKLPHMIPADRLDHPVLGKGLSRTPRSTAAGNKKAASNTKAPAAGDNEKE